MAMMDELIKNTEYFELQIGGFFDGFTRVRLEKKLSEYTLGYYPGFANPEDAKKEMLSKDVFDDVLQKIYSSNIFDWEEEYVDPDIDDGTQWTIRIKMKNEEEREWYGCNMYPDKEEWNRFIQIINTLTIPPLEYEI